jgi:hypothetical protein
MNWLSWINSQWSDLQGGKKVTAPGWLPTPRESGFQPIPIASPEGQCADWGLSLTDGSRVHVHQFNDGRRVVHRDRFDPDQGILRGVAHLLTETWVGPVALVAGLALLISLPTKS